MKAISAVEIVVIMLILGCGGDDDTLTGTWTGTLTDGSLAEIAREIDFILDVEITDERRDYYQTLLFDFPIVLRFKQTESSVSGNIEFFNGEIVPIQGGAFIADALTFFYVERGTYAKDRRIDVNGTLSGKTLTGKWGGMGEWKVSKQP